MWDEGLQFSGSGFRISGFRGQGLVFRALGYELRFEVLGLDSNTEESSFFRALGHYFCMLFSDLPLSLRL